MPIRVTPFVLVLGCALLGHAKDAWHWQHPISSANVHSAVHFTDSSTGYIAGCCGSILKTSDGGGKWRTLDIGRTDIGIRSLRFPTRDIGFAAGDSGLVFKTADAGETWTGFTTGTRRTLTGIHFTDALTGYAVGTAGLVARTRDGGATWDTATPGGMNNLLSVHFPSRVIGYASGANGLLLKTTDAGETWNAQAVPAGGAIRSIRFAHPDSGLAVADSSVLLSTRNGGLLWTRTKLSASSLFAVEYADSRAAVVVGTATQYHSQDGGARWNLFNLPNGFESLYALHFGDRNTGYAVGSNPRIAKTVDQGRTWKYLHSDLPLQTLNAVAFATPTEGHAVGSSGLIARTRDGGRTWSFKYRPLYTPELHAVFFLDTGLGYIAGGNSNGEGGLVLRTENGGETWFPLSTGVGTPLRAIHFTDNLNGVVVGGNYGPGGNYTRQGVILRTTDGGIRWDSLPMPSIHVLYSVHFPLKHLGYACGDSGTIFRTLDGGAHWNPLPAPTPRRLNSILFLDDRTGLAAAQNGLFRTVDSGTTWSRLPGDTVYGWRSISKTRGDTLWVVGGRGKAARSVDGGKSWTDFRAPTDLALADGFFLDGSNGFVVGERGLILRRGATMEEPVTVRKPSGNARRKASRTGREDSRGFDANGRWQGQARNYGVQSRQGKVRPQEKPAWIQFPLLNR